jgi:hypothetical protein
MTDAPGKHERCTGVTRAGERCKGRALPGSVFCLNHDPAKVTQLAEWRRQGGHARSNVNRARKRLKGGLRDFADLQGLLFEAVRKVEAGSLEPGPANAMANLARACAALAGLASFEERLSALEAQFAERKSG